MQPVEPVNESPDVRPELRRRLDENIARVRAAVAEAAARSGRDPAEITLVAVTKYVDLEVIAALLDLGVSDLGENQVQQLAARAAACGPAQFDWPDQHAPSGSRRPRWHMIGHLQRNKVRILLPHARIIHSLDSIRLAETLERQLTEIERGQPVHPSASGADPPAAADGLDVLIELNIAGEATKEGVSPADLDELVAATRACPHLRLRGLMTMAPYSEDPEASRPHFARLRELLDSLRRRGAVPADCRHLSMGMSQDYPVAIAEGATLVRVGSVLFEGLPSVDPRNAAG